MYNNHTKSLDNNSDRNLNIFNDNILDSTFFLISKFVVGLIILIIFLLFQSTLVQASNNVSQPQFALTIGNITGSVTANYVYTSIFNPVGSGKAILIRHVSIQIDATAAAAYQTVTLRKVTAASAGTSISASDIFQKNSNTNLSIAQIRYTGPTVTLGGGVNSRIISVVGPGAAGSMNGYKDVVMENSEPLTLMPGEGVALYQEAAGSANQKVRMLVEWDEQNTTTNPIVPKDEYMMSTPIIGVAAGANYVYASMFNPITSNKTAIVKRLAIEVDCSAAAIYTNNISIRRTTAASAGTLIANTDIPQKYNSSNTSLMEIRHTGATVTFAGSVDSRIAMITPCGAADQYTGHKEYVFDTAEENIILKQGEGLALYTESAGNANQKVRMFVEWDEVVNISTPTPKNEFIITYPKLAVAATANYVYQSFYNPVASGKVAIIKRIEMRVDAVGAATYQPISIRKITAASAGTLITQANVPKKHSSTANTMMELRYINPTVTFLGTPNSTILDIIGAGAVGQLGSRKEFVFNDHEKVILQPGEGIAMFSEAAGSVNQYVDFSIEWEEEPVASTPTPQNEYLLNIGELTGVANANYNYTALFNPPNSNKTAIIHRFYIGVNAVAAAAYIPFSLKRINASSGGILINASDIPKKNNLSNFSVMAVRYNGPIINFSGTSNSRLESVQSPGTVGSATAPQLSGLQETYFPSEDFILQPGEGVTLSAEGAGSANFKINLFVEWQEIPSNQTLNVTGDRIISVGPVAGSLTSGYVYTTVFNPPNSNRNYIFERLGVRGDRIGAMSAPGYIPLSVKKISSSTGGILLNASDITNKNTLTQNSTVEIRYGGPNVNYLNGPEAHIYSTTIPGAVGQNYGNMEIYFISGDELILKPGEGLALYQESNAGDVNIAYRTDMVWNESIIDSTPPIISFNSNTTSTGMNSQNWIYASVNATDDKNLNMTFIRLYNSTNILINTINGTNSITSINFTNLVDGIYYLNATANDSAGNYNSTETRIITLDTTKPSIQFTASTDISANLYNRNFIQANVTASDLYLTNITLRLYNSSGSWINNTYATSNNLFTNFTGMSDGIYYFNATASDAANNSNSTETRNVTLDANPPYIINVLPTQGSAFNETQSININATIVDTVKLDVKYANITWPNGTIIGVPLTLINGNIYGYILNTGGIIGIYNVTFFANDSSNQINNTVTTWFRVRTEGKTIDLVNVNGTAISYVQNITFNVSGILNVDLYPVNNIIQKISILGFNQSSPYSIIRIDQNISTSNEYLQTYSINLDSMNYTYANYTVTAKGYYLLKCANFSFATRTCNDEDVVPFLSGLISGQNYTLVYNATDPGFYESLQGSSVSMDSYVRQGNANTNYGSAANIRVGKSTNNNAARGIILFNTSDISTGATVIWANLSLYFYNIPAGNVNTTRTQAVYRVLASSSRPWKEMTVTWNRYNSTNIWTTAGGDYNNTFTDNNSFNSSSLGTWITFNVTSDVQAFISDPTNNFGWIIKDIDETTLNTLRDYASSQYSNFTLAPRLDYLLSDGTEGTYIINSSISTRYSFIGGNFNNTKLDYGAYAIALKNITTTNGTWLSQIFDAGDIVQWGNMSWTSSAIGNLPGNKIIETKFSSGNAAMNNNLLLMHFDNDSVFNENSTYFYDYSASGNNGNCSGTSCPIYISGKINSGLNFVGANYVDTGLLQNAVATYTIGAWIKTSAAQGVLIHDRGSGTGLSLTLAIGPSCGAPGSYCPNSSAGVPGFGLDSNGVWMGVNGPTSINDGKWHHVVGVFSSTSGQTLNTSNFALYVDGISASVSPGIIGTANSPLTGDGGTKIGWHSLWTMYFIGAMDEVMIFDRNLSSSEISNIYQRGITRLNFTARSCLDIACTSATMVDINDTSPQSITPTYVSPNRYFQYGVTLETDNPAYTPKLNNVTINYNRDLYITNGDITFSNNNPMENESIIIFAKIHSEYNINYSNVLIRFYKGDPDAGGTQIGTDKYINVTGIQNVTSNITWNVPAGTSKIYVKIDPLNSILETDKTNNKAYNVSFIPAWQIYYGNVSSVTQLGSSSNGNNTFEINWSIRSYPNMNIYVAPSGSSINWLALQALTRNNTGGTNASTLDDFHEVDLSLGIENFTDSINNTYSIGGLPIRTSNYTLYIRNVSYVPEAQSTNNTNFYTGILWDTSDTATPYYTYISNPTSRTDILFVTKVNYNQTGKYGLYDYELRVPAFLRNYKGVGGVVQFYYEIQ